MELNECQKRSLAILDKLLTLDRQHMERVRAAWQKKSQEELEKFEPKSRVTNGEDFITSKAKNPSGAEKPNQWATDWCEGWKYHLRHEFAEALGIKLLSRSENGKTVLVWAQGTAFNFCEGHVIHTYPSEYENETWAIQMENMDHVLQIYRAVPAKSIAKNKENEFYRYFGWVEFDLYKNENGKLEKIARHECTQDNFVRYLITGLLPEK